MLAEAGTLSAAIVDHADRMELGLSTMVAAGNRADVVATDLLSYWIEDDRTDAVLLYLAARHLRPRFVRAPGPPRAQHAGRGTAHLDGVGAASVRRRRRRPPWPRCSDRRA